MTRVLTSHVGSLPRPPRLAALLKRRHDGDPLDAAEFERQCADAIREAVSLQAQCGIDIVSDGEMSKLSYAYYVQDRLAGFERAEAARAQGRPLRRFQQLVPPGVQFADYAADRARQRIGPVSVKPPVCIGPLSYRDTNAVSTDLARLKEAVALAGARSSFMTAASPGVVAMFASETSHYATEDEYVFALAEALRPEYEAIHAAGVMLQVDCPDLTLTGRMLYLDRKEDPLRLVARNIEALDHALRNIPGDRVRLHLCWGNYAGPHVDDIEARTLFPFLRRTRARLVSFEAANPRHEHEWEDWKDAGMPDDMVLMPGVIDSTTNFVEHPRLVAQRIRRFVDAVGSQRVIAGADCGFGTFASDTPLVFPSVVWAKLRSLSQGAELAA